MRKYAHITIIRMHSTRMHTDCTITWMSSDRVAIRPIVNRMTQVSENITFLLRSVTRTMFPLKLCHNVAAISNIVAVCEFLSHYDCNQL